MGGTQPANTNTVNNSKATTHAATQPSPCMAATTKTEAPTTTLRTTLHIKVPTTKQQQHEQQRDYKQKNNNKKSSRNPSEKKRHYTSHCKAGKGYGNVFWRVRQHQWVRKLVIFLLVCVSLFWRWDA